MSLYKEPHYHNPLANPYVSGIYEEASGYRMDGQPRKDSIHNERTLGGGTTDHRSHPMDVVYLDDSKTPIIPPYLKALPNDGTNGNDESLLGSSPSKKSSLRNGEHDDDDESGDADAAAGVSTVLKRVTSLGAMVTSTSFSALAGLGGGAAAANDELAPKTVSTRRSSIDAPPTPTRRNTSHEGGGSSSNLNIAMMSHSNNNNSSSTMLNQYYSSTSSNDLSILNNPNHRNYLRAMNASKGPLGSIPQPLSPLQEPPEMTVIKPSWRLRDRMKTVGVGLIMALNVGTDPPDIVKPHPSATLQCWMDPHKVSPKSKAKDQIGDKLQKQYERFTTSSSSRQFKCRKALDPTVEDVRALCLGLRKQARHERVLLHYNGHGVPKPTRNGEIWVFDKNHTEYIPLSVSDLRQWVGKPTIVILDCSSAGVLVPFLTAPPAETPSNTPPRVASPILADQSQQQPQGILMNGIQKSTSSDNADPAITTMDEAASIWVKDTIVLCPTSEDEWLPMNPEYPADIFTSCLTTPIQMALRWFVRNNRISMGALFHGRRGGEEGSVRDNGPDIAVDSIPGQATDRKTPLGELNWIFTSITDSIAWNVLPKPLFHRLFRQDLLVAATFRNFFLADRILRSFNCTPQSYPPMPPGIADHPLWQAWDLACETCLFGLIKNGIIGRKNNPSKSVSEKRMQQGATREQSLSTLASSPFFSEQLTGFEVWLEYASIHGGNIDHLEPPEQLPVVLQVLLSQAHRARALELVRRFLVLGPWAVNQALTLGIFPYVMKLLQSPEYKTVLVNIWASILKFDPSCQVDLAKDKRVKDFIETLAHWSKRATSSDSMIYSPEAVKQRTLIAFCLASVCYKYPQAQTECVNQSLHKICTGLLSAQIKLQERKKQQQQEEEGEQHTSQRRASQDATQYVLLSPIAREWVCMCLGNLVQAYNAAQTEAYGIGVHECLMRLQQDDDDPSVRAAATYALGKLLEHVSLPSSNTNVSRNMPSMISPLSRGRLQQTPQPPATTAMNPHIGSSPVGFGPQVFSNTGPPMPAGIPPSFSGGILSSEGQLLPQQQQSMFLPNPMPTAGVLQPTPTIPVVNQGPASVALSAAMSRGGLAPTQQQFHSIPNLGMAGAMATPQQQQLPIQTPIPQPMQGQAQGMPDTGVPILSPQAMLPQQQQEQQSGMPRVMSALTPQHPGVPLVGIGAQLGPPQPQMITRATSGPQLGGTSQLFHPQQRTPNMMPSMGGYLGPAAGMTSPPSAPIGMPIMGSPLEIRASQVGSPIMAMRQMRSAPPQQQRRPPTVYENRRRIEFDMKVMESMIKVLADGSVIVRYEVIMAFSNFVEKYLQAILVIAEDATRVMDKMRLGNISEDPDEGENGMNNYSGESNPNRVVQLPEGVNQMIMGRFERCWKALRLVQHDDPHPNVSRAANSIVRVVHETLYDMRMELDARTKARNKIDGGLTGIEEEEETGNDGMERVRSDANISLASPDQLNGITNPNPQSDGPSNRLPVPNAYPLRRSTSEAAVRNFPAMSIGNGKSVPTLALPGRNLMDRVKVEKLLPKSELYEWKKSIFRPDYDDEDADDCEDLDPLNPLGAARNYQRRRNTIVRRDGNKIAKHFVPLKPRREVQKKSLDALLGDDGEDEKDEMDAYLQSELKLEEKQLLKNKKGVEMTRMLKFHTYENALAVFDNQDYISIWDYESGARKSSFKNGNPTGSRMTSAFWINESSSSLLFVGCDDGSARIWDGIVQHNGRVSTQAPTLLSAFFAIPNMEAGRRGKSGLICEWQQTTGTLISGGNSRNLHCWDMTAEKCSNIIEVEADKSCITALTTAWDEENATAIQNNGFRGTGPEIIVAGLSDGTLKLFDIRMSRSGAAMTTSTMANDAKLRSKVATNRRRLASLNNKTFTEHGSWIVDVSFTSYGNQNEILSGCVAGHMRAWDIRMSSRSLRDIQVQSSPMTALSVHRKIPIAASGSHAQFIKILTLEGEALQSVKFHDLTGIKYDRIGPVSCLEFHRQKLVLAAGSTNALVSVYQPRRRPRV